VPPPVPVVTLDANVLFPASLRDLLLRAVESGLYKLALSREGWDEVARNLVKTGRMTPAGAAHLETQVLAFLTDHDALIAGYEEHLPALTNHPKDRHVLAVAIAAGARTIITFNQRDFPAAALAPYGITALHPDLFLLSLLDAHAEVFRRLIHAQSAALRSPPVSVAAVVETLAQHIPETAKRLRALG